MFRLPTSLAALVLSGAAIAQGPLSNVDRIIGWADYPLPAAASTIDWQQIASCRRATSVCKMRFPLRAPVFYAGGTAYDARYQSIWYSDGRVLLEQYVRGCRTRCKAKPVLISRRALISGLAISDAKPRLFQLATFPGYAEIVTYDNSKCPPKAISKCTFNLGGKTIAAGLAYDESHDILMWTISTPLSSGAYQNVLLMSKASKPCNPFCKALIMQNCSRKPVLGLAYDACTQLAYATDGAVTQTLGIDSKNCRVKQGKCCKKQAGGTWRGLALVSTWKKTVTTKSCTSRPCPSCPNMRLNCRGGDAVMGNTNFGFQVTGAPAGSIGVLVVGFGACKNPGLPFGCGRLVTPFAPIFPLVYPASVIGGSGSACSGAAKWPFPIPGSAKVCKLVLCTQLAIFCPTSVGFGSGLSNSVQIRIAGN